MDNFLYSDRFLLRTWRVEDAEYLFLLNADNRVLRFTGDIPFKSVSEAHQFIITYKKNVESTGFYRWAVVDKQRGHYIGWCGLRKVNDEVDLGFRLRYADWGRGIASETSKVVIDHAFNTLKCSQLVARTHPENTRSINCLIRLGFKNAQSMNAEGFAVYSLDRP